MRYFRPRLTQFSHYAKRENFQLSELNVTKTANMASKAGHSTTKTLLRNKEGITQVFKEQQSYSGTTYGHQTRFR